MKTSALTNSVNDQDTAIPQAVYEELISWIVRLNSGTVQDEQWAEFERWRSSDPLHEKAWIKLQSIDLSFRGVDQDSAPFVSDSLELVNMRRKATIERRKKIKLLGVGAIAVMSGSLFLTTYAPGIQEQSYTAAIGQKETVVLADGTKLLLNTNTKVDIKLSFFKREIVMQQGEIYIETGKDTDSLIGRRPFWVQTSQAGLEAIGTRFAVKQGINTSRLHVTQGIVAMHVGSNKPVSAYANDTYTIAGSNHLPAKLNALTIDPVGWVDDVIIAKQMRLDDFAAELSSYHTAPVYCDFSSKALKVSGVFQLDVPHPVDHTLNAIARTLPVKLISQEDNSVLITHK